MCRSRVTSVPSTSLNSASSARQAAATATGDVEHRAVVLHEPDPVAVDERLGEVPQLVLDSGQLRDPVDQRGARRQHRVEPGPQAGTGLAPAGGEDVLDQGLPADLDDRGQEAGGEAVVVGREEVLGVGRDVVQVPRPPHAMAHRGPRDEAGAVEGP